MATKNTGPKGPLEGLRIVELGHFVAAPFACRVLADLGAEVIKIEPPKGGDPARRWGAMVNGQSIWWSVHARNKRSIAVDLKQEAGRKILLDLIRNADAVVENFRPGQLERWGVGADAIKEANPDCIVVRISGFGQTGPYRNKPAFGLIGEAIGGIRYLTGFPKGVTALPPARVGISLGDSVAGLYAVIGVLAGIYNRSKSRQQSGPVDIALYESIFSLLEGALPEYGRLGIVRQPAGSALPTAAPSNSYKSLDEEWICIGGNSDRIFERLAKLIGRPELALDPRFATNDARVANMGALDQIISEWVRTRPALQAEAELAAADIPACRIYTIADCVQDDHFHQRNMIRVVDDEFLGKILHPGIVPKFSSSGQEPIRSGPKLGADTNGVLSKTLGYNEAQIAELRSRGVLS